jgi:hypothetical protein
MSHGNVSFGEGFLASSDHRERQNSIVYRPFRETLGLSRIPSNRELRGSIFLKGELAAEALIAAMQASPYRYIIEPKRDRMLGRGVDLLRDVRKSSARFLRQADGRRLGRWAAVRLVP